MDSPVGADALSTSSTGRHGKNQDQDQKWPQRADNKKGEAVRRSRSSHNSKNFLKDLPGMSVSLSDRQTLAKERNDMTTLDSTFLGPELAGKAGSGLRKQTKP